MQQRIDLSYRLDENTPEFPGGPPPEMTILDSTDEESTEGVRPLNGIRISDGLHRCDREEARNTRA